MRCIVVCVNGELVFEGPPIGLLKILPGLIMVRVTGIGTIRRNGKFRIFLKAALQ